MAGDKAASGKGRMPDSGGVMRTSAQSVCAWSGLMLPGAMLPPSATSAEPRTCGPDALGVKTSWPGWAKRPFGRRQWEVVAIMSWRTSTAVQTSGDPVTSRLPTAACQVPTGAGGTGFGVSGTRAAQAPSKAQARARTNGRSRDRGRASLSAAKLAASVLLEFAIPVFPVARRSAFVFALALALLSSAMVPTRAPAHEITAGALTISHPWSRATAGSAKAGALYLT